MCAAALHCHRLARPQGHLVGHRHAALFSKSVLHISILLIPLKVSYLSNPLQAFSPFLDLFLSCPLLPTKRYKNNVAIDPLAHPGKFKLESRYSVHSLEINRYVHSPNHSIRNIDISTLSTYVLVSLFSHDCVHWETKCL